MNLVKCNFCNFAFFASFPLQNHADEFKIPRFFFISSPSKLKGFHYQIKYQLREPTICQIFSKNANGLAKKLFFASFEMLLLPSKIIMIIVIGKPIYYCESNSSRLRILVWSNIKTPIQEVI